MRLKPIFVVVFCFVCFGVVFFYTFDTRLQEYTLLHLYIQNAHMCSKPVIQLSFPEAPLLAYVCFFIMMIAAKTHPLMLIPICPPLPLSRCGAVCFMVSSLNPSTESF